MNSRYLKLVLTCAALNLVGLAAKQAIADTVQYAVSVDTSSVASQYGYIDLEFNGSSILPVQQATLDVSNFSTDGTLNPSDPSPLAVGDATGSLQQTPTPTTLAFDNQSSSSDYTEGITFGNSITFDVTINGPAVGSVANGTGSAVFQVDFLNSDMSGFLLSNNPTGAFTSDPNSYYDFNAGIIFLNSDGSLTPVEYPNLGGGPSALTFTQVVPEPGAASLAMSVIVLLPRQRRRVRVS
jgi:hypothetical protein